MHCREVNRYVEGLRTAPDFDRLRLELVAAKQGLGFDHFSLIQADSSLTDGATLLLQDFPDAFISLLADTFLYRHSPVLRAVGRVSRPFRWSELEAILDLSVEQQDYLRLAADHGIVHGYTVPIHIPGEPSGLVSFVSRADNPIHERRLPPAQFIASHGFDAARRLLRKAKASDAVEGLDAIDREVILWLARGKTRWMIARKLGLSEASVSEAILRARRHYRVGSHTEMVVRALYDRTIGFEDVMR